MGCAGASNNGPATRLLPLLLLLVSGHAAAAAVSGGGGGDLVAAAHGALHTRCSEPSDGAAGLAIAPVQLP